MAFTESCATGSDWKSGAGICFCSPMPEGTGSRFYTGMAAAFGAAPNGWNVEDLAGQLPKTKWLTSSKKGFRRRYSKSSTALCPLIGIDSSSQSIRSGYWKKDCVWYESRSTDPAAKNFPTHNWSSWKWSPESAARKCKLRVNADN